MSRIISELLGYDPDYLGSVIARLEVPVDDHAIDVALIGDLAKRSAALHRQFKLDPADTTPQELYATLRSRVRDDNTRLAGAMGGKHPDAISEMTPLILKSIRNHIGQRHCWALKSSSAKKILKAHPPRVLMSALGYRSVDSFLKHEPIAHIMVAMRYVESPSWNSELTRSYTQLTPRDFESRAIEIIYLDKLAYIEPLAGSIKRHALVLHSKEMGVVAIAPSREKVIRGYTLRTATLLLHYCAEITMMSTLLKYRHTKRDYGESVVAALTGDETGHIEMADHPSHWRSVHRTIHAVGHDAGPHMNKGDWLHESANDSIARLVETMIMWAGYGHVATHRHDVIGYNIVDLAIDEAADAAFAQRSLRYVRQALETELIHRYLLHPTHRRVVFGRLNID